MESVKNQWAALMGYTMIPPCDTQARQRQYFTVFLVGFEGSSNSLACEIQTTLHKVYFSPMFKKETIINVVVA